MACNICPVTVSNMAAKRKATGLPGAMERIRPNSSLARFGCVGVRVFQQHLNRLSVLCHRRHDVALFLIHMSQHFQKGHTAWPGRQIFPQEGFCQPIVLPLHRLASQGFERGSRTHQASKSQVESGEESPSFGIERIECEQVLQRGRCPAILAGVHLCNRIFEQRRLLVVADGALFLDFWRGLLSDLRGVFLSDRTV